MINPNARFFLSGYIMNIVKHTSMTIINVRTKKGTVYQYTSFNYKRRFKINDDVRCAIKFSIFNDSYYIEDLKRIKREV